MILTEKETLTEESVVSVTICPTHGISSDETNKDYTKKGKTIPLQAWTGPEGSRTLRLPDFKTIGT